MLLFVFFLIGGTMAVGPWAFAPEMADQLRIGATMAVGPWALPREMADQLGMGAKAVISITGVGVLALVAIVSVFTRLYRKTSANMAFVRTGGTAAKVILDRGAVVIPVMHHV